MEWIACVATISCHFPVRDIERVSEQAGEHVLGEQKNMDKGRVWGKKFSPPSPPSRSPPPPPFQFFAYPRHAPSLTCFLTHLFNLSTWRRKGHGYYERLWNWKCKLLYWDVPIGEKALSFRDCTILSIPSNETDRSSSANLVHSDCPMVKRIL